LIRFPQDNIVVRPVDDFLLGERLANMQGRAIGPTELFRLLNAAGLKGVLIDAHAINARSGEPRATLDVDIVAERPKKVVDVFRRAYPALVVEDHPVVVRFKDQGKEAIDVIKPASSPLFKRVLKLTEVLNAEGVAVTVADAEALLALKFQAMVSPARRMEKKHRDASDFILLAKQLPRVYQAKLTQLGELVYPDGGGRELIKLVTDARAGRRLEF
jgi:hypothetical protein